MSSEMVIKILENEREESRKRAEQKKFSLGQLRRLNRLVESEGSYISSALWDLLLFKVDDLQITASGNISYVSADKPSKRVISFLAKYNKLIVDNLHYIMHG